MRKWIQVDHSADAVVTVAIVSAAAAAAAGETAGGRDAALVGQLCCRSGGWVGTIDENVVTAVVHSELYPNHRLSCCCC